MFANTMSHMFAKKIILHGMKGQAINRNLYDMIYLISCTIVTRVF
jgi:hypothetical protein